MTEVQRLPAPVRVWTVLCAALFLGLSWQLRDYTPDDAFISFAYAQRHAAGDGWVASAGTPPVEGFSNPLYVFLLDAAARAELPIVETGKGIGLTSGVLLVLATGALTWTLTASFLATGAASLLIATWPPLALWSASGMENSLYGLCLVMGSLTLVRESARANSSMWSAAWWIAALWLRPEAFGLAAVAVVWCVLTRPGIAMRWTLVLASGFVALLLWRYTTFDEWLPNTYYAKRNNLLVGNGWGYLWRGTQQLGFGAVVVPLAVVGGIRALTRGLRNPLTLIAGLAFAHATFVVVVGGDWMHQFRFLTVLAPFVVVLGAERLGAAVAAVHASSERLRHVAVPVLALVWIFSWPPMWDAARENRSVDIMGEDWEPYRDALHDLEGALGAGASLVVPELGYPSFATGLRVLDPLGLGSAHVAHLRYERVDRLLADVWQPDAIKAHSLVADALKLNRSRWFREGYIPTTDVGEWLSAPEIPDTWYVSRRVFERSPAEVAALGGARFTLDGGLELHRVRCVPRAVRPGEPVYVELTWMPTAGPAEFHYAVATLSPTGSNIGTTMPPLHGWVPSSQWEPGVGIVDRIPIGNAVDAVSGMHKVAIRFVDPETKAPMTIAYAGGVAGSTNDVRTEYEVVRELSPERLDAMLARTRALRDEDKLEDAWDALAAARAIPSGSDELQKLQQDIGLVLAETELEGLTGTLAAEEIRAHTERAREFAGAKWPDVRDAFADTLLRDLPRGRPGVTPSWEQVVRVALVATLRPESHTAQQRWRVWWKTRVEADRRMRLRSAQTWASDRGEYERDEARLRFLPAIPLDALEHLTLMFDGSPTTDTRDVLLQCLLFDAQGYAAVTLPLSLPQNEPNGPSTVALSSTVREQVVRLHIAVDSGVNLHFRVGSTAPNPWGAPFYPPVAPSLVGLSVLTANDEAPRLPLPVRVGVVKVRPIDDAIPALAAGFSLAWPAETEALAMLDTVRAYERVDVQRQ